MRLVVTVIAFMGLLTACSSHARVPWTDIETNGRDEMTEREIVFEKVKKLFAERDLKALDALEAQYRSTRERTASGVWKLHLYYSALEWLTVPTGPETGCALRGEDVLEKWAGHSPKSPGPNIVKATALEAKAWCLRGTGFSHTVSGSAAEQFGAVMAEAENLLEKHRKVASADPQFYATLANVYRSVGKSPDEFSEMLNEATDHEASYPTLYANAFRYYQPRWFGAPGDVEKFASYAASRSVKEDGQSMYARTFWSIWQCNCMSDFATLDWPKMKAGMADIFERYPTDWNATNFASFACERRDLDTAAVYLAKIKQEQPKAWKSPQHQEFCMRVTAYQRSKL